MILVKLSYKDANWELQDLELSPVNLIVAKNATGKSRTLQAIDHMIRIITQRGGFLDKGGHWSTEFITAGEETLKYLFSTRYNEQLQQSFIKEEKLFVNDVQVLDRNENDATIKNGANGNSDVVNPPPGKLVLHTNRDVKKYPFLESIANWAESSFGFTFSGVIPGSNLNRTFFELLNVVKDTPDQFMDLNAKSREVVRTELNKIGFNISEITADYVSNGAVIIYVKEDEVEKAIRHWELSQGMYRALSIIIFIEYLVSIKKPPLIVIDDLCEGMDYERARALGKFLFDKCLDSDIQLIATSNDSFLMDEVDIKYWNVLLRHGKIVAALNYRNSKKVFDDFRFTGLSNFDFFSSDFLSQKLAS